MNIKKMSKILICPDKFKYSLKGSQICEIIRKSLPTHYKIVSLPLADGGDGSLDAIKHNIKGQFIKVPVNDPFFRPIISQYFINYKGDIGFIQMARASGLELLKKEQKNPLKTSTFGTGQLIKHCIQHKNVNQIFLMIGGSSTNDGGIGMASALGFQFYDKSDISVNPLPQNFLKIHRIDPPSSNILDRTKIVILTDVKNPLCGKNGASHIYGPQKGANQRDVRYLDQGLDHLDQIFQKCFGKSVKNIEGSGAAGGLGGGGIIFLNAQIKSGIQTIIDIVQFKKHARECDILITGQGKLDEQTLNGKVISGVMQTAKQYNKKLMIFCGKSEVPSNYFGENIQIIPLLHDGITEQYCIQNTQKLLMQAVSKRFACLY